MFDLKIGFKCNNNCIHCVVADKRCAGILDIPHIMNILKKVPNGEAVQITGGEPSIFTYLPDILKACKDKNCKTIIQSNGTGFSDKSFFEKCKPYIDHIHIAIHSYDEKVHDNIVGSQGMWQKTIKGWENILSSGIYCTTQTVLSTYNINTLYDTFSFIQKKAPNTYMSMTYPHLMGNAYKNRDFVAFRFSDYKEEIQRTLKDFKENIFTEAIPPCYLYPYFPYNSAENDILSNCTRTGVDFSSNQDVKNYNKLDVESKRKGPKCKECVFNSHCIGVWKEYVEMFKNKLDLYPIKEVKSCC